MAPRITEAAGRALRTIGAASTIGFSFVFAVLIGAGIGYLLDRWTGAGGVFFIIFFFLGLAAGILNFFRISARVFERREPPPGS
jgi:ATP synthase protein I